MKLIQAAISNFRRLESVEIDFEDTETIFVGPNNSGKTSATAIFRSFLGGRDFRIHDYSVARIADFEQFVRSNGATAFPEISLDLWFSIDPNSIAFGRVFYLLPKLAELDRVGIRLAYGLKDPPKLLESYAAAYPANDQGVRAKTLFDFLDTDGNLSRHCVVRQASLGVKEDSGGNATIVANSLDRDEGTRLLKNLIRVEFVDAQRNIDDEDGSRSNRLSSAFAAYYRKNLEQADHAAEAHRIIDQNNDQLTAHYKTQFAPLINLIENLGVSNINERQLEIVSSISPETALRGNTALLYVDDYLKHKLPELYNGLGFKNLIYMAIQARHFHSQWLQTAESRPLCLMIFIEEPEVHLHAQVQQAFINNVWRVINESAIAAGKPGMVPQLVVTTHSSHILDAVEFEKVRYFQRRHIAPDGPENGVRNATSVRSLRKFQPAVEEMDGVSITPAQSIAFLKKYLRLTHCDLFFADAAMLVEGAVEKLLMPSMIERSSPNLRTTYLTILEVGGAYAHRFEGLLEFLHIPYLVITDLDSVVPTGYPTACRADMENARTSNASLKKFCGKSTVKELIEMTQDQKVSVANSRCVTFQMSVLVTDGTAQLPMLPRTLEEAIAYENFTLLRSSTLSIGKTIPAALSDAYDVIYEHIRSNSFKKTDFAMSLLASPSAWTTPQYIVDGLVWLEQRLCKPRAAAQVEGADAAAVEAIDE